MLNELHACGFHSSWRPPSQGRESWYPRNVGACLLNQWTSADSSCQYRFKRYSESQTPLHISSRFSTYRISRKFQRFWSDTTKTFSPRTHVTWCNLLWFRLFPTPYIKPIRRPRLRYSGRHLSNVSLSCTWNEKGEIYAPHQSRHCRKCIRSPARSPGGHTADSEQDGISKKSRKRKGDSELCVTINKLS